MSKRGASGVNGSRVLFGDLAYRLEVNAVSNELFSVLSGGSAVPDRRWKDCEDRQRSLMVLGCGSVTAGVTPGMTGFVPWCDLSARGRRPPARLEELA